MKVLVERKYLWITRAEARRPDGRKFRFRLNRLPSNVYVQIGRFEMIVWYR